MLTPDLLHDYQKKAVNFQCTHPHSMLWLDPGLGKTITTLTTLAHLLRNGFLKGVVVVAPIRVIRLVWKQEAAKWEHTKHLRFSMVTGTRDQRTRALLRPADVYLINYENLGWLSEVLQTYFVRKGLPMPFNGVVWDEISKMKNSSTDRVKAFRKIANQFIWTTGLTGTPASNGYKDLHGQFLVVDRGERLGTSKTAFRTRFYRKAGPFKEIPYDDTEDTIKKLIGDITLEMSAADYMKMPDLIINNIEVDMPDDLRAKYDHMEKEFFLRMDSGTEVEVFNQASLTNKLLQFGNGAMYPVAGMPLWESVHELKLDALEEIIEESNGQQVFCSYAYRSDAERIMTRFKHLNPINLTDCKSEHSLTNAMTRWAAGDCALMIAHPACLHPRTQVLTEWRGWVRIVDVMPDERVFDGVEFVSHSGCSYSGYKDVMTVFGITMTPDHKLFVGGEWIEAKNVKTDTSSKRAALYEYQGDAEGISAMSTLWEHCGIHQAKLRQTQSEKGHSLLQMHSGEISQSHRNAHLENLAWDEVASKGCSGQELRRTWDNCKSRVVDVFKLLQRHVRRIFGRPNTREDRCESSLQCDELQMGYQHGATVQQAKQQIRDIHGRADSSCRTGATIWSIKDEATDATQSWDDRGRCGERLRDVRVRKESECCEHTSKGKAHVYDLVDCGPRHQFLVRNDEGEMFISHNSAGHGIDGLQKAGHTIVWFGLNWSLELYDQFNARIRRQGQGAPVICHRILMRDTMDQAQALALDEKATTQSDLRKAIKSYRNSRNL